MPVALGFFLSKAIQFNHICLGLSLLLRFCCRCCYVSIEIEIFNRIANAQQAWNTISKLSFVECETSARIAPFFNPETILCDLEFFSLLHFFFCSSTSMFCTVKTHAQWQWSANEELYQQITKRMFDLHLHMHSIFWNVLKMERKKQHLLDASLRPHTGWRALSSVLFVLCALVLFRCVALFPPTLSLIRLSPLTIVCNSEWQCAVQSAQQKRNARHFKHTNWVISNSWNSHISFSGVTFFYLVSGSIVYFCNRLKLSTRSHSIRQLIGTIFYSESHVYVYWCFCYFATIENAISVEIMQTKVGENWNYKMRCHCFATTFYNKNMFWTKQWKTDEQQQREITARER